MPLPSPPYYMCYVSINSWRDAPFCLSSEYKGGGVCNKRGLQCFQSCFSRGLVSKSWNSRAPHAQYELWMHLKGSFLIGSNNKPKENYFKENHRHPIISAIRKTFIRVYDQRLLSYQLSYQGKPTISQFHRYGIVKAFLYHQILINDINHLLYYIVII
jgi:hypothetical protein